MLLPLEEIKVEVHYSNHYLISPCWIMRQCLALFFFKWQVGDSPSHEWPLFIWVSSLFMVIKLPSNLWLVIKNCQFGQSRGHTGWIFSVGCLVGYVTQGIAPITYQLELACLQSGYFLAKGRKAWTESSMFYRFVCMNFSAAGEFLKCKPSWLRRSLLRALLCL